MILSLHIYIYTYIMYGKIATELNICMLYIYIYYKHVECRED